MLERGNEVILLQQGIVWNWLMSGCFALGEEVLNLAGVLERGEIQVWELALSKTWGDVYCGWGWGMSGCFAEYSFAVWLSMTELLSYSVGWASR